MFENLTNKLENIFSKLKKAPSLDEGQVESGLKEIRQALLEADVSLPVTKEFIQNIKPKAIGQEIIRSTSPGQMIVKIVNDELIKVLGVKNQELNFNAVPPVSLLLVGLQGSGKTTTATKLAKLIEKKFKKKTMLVSLDVYRPAAQEQLKILAEKNNIVNLPIVEKQLPLDITKRALGAANLNGSDVIIFDTAGRTQIDLNMMTEIKQIKELTKPTETILVADALTGQIAVNIAKEFDSAVDISGIILTRVDGDGRGGAALSMKSITGKPIKFIGVGEKIEDLEEDWLLQQLHDENEHIRVWSLKFLTDSGEVSNKSLTSFVRLAKSDSSGLVQVHLASVLRLLPLSMRWELATELASKNTFAEDPVLPLMIWYGISPSVGQDRVGAIEFISKPLRS